MKKRSYIIFIFFGIALFGIYRLCSVADDRSSVLGTVAWHWLRATAQIVQASWKFNRVKKPIVVVFGGHRVAETEPLYQKAHELGGRLVSAGFVALSGAGTGVMKAIDCGAVAASDGSLASIGLTVEGLGNVPGRCTQLLLRVSDFFARKWLMITRGSAFIIFPGGVGTMDEIMEILTLISVEKLEKKPLIFFDTQYWHLVRQWLYDVALKQGLIKPGVLDDIVFVDTIDQVMDYLKTASN